MSGVVSVRRIVCLPPDWPAMTHVDYRSKDLQLICMQQQGIPSVGNCKLQLSAIGLWTLAQTWLYGSGLRALDLEGVRRLPSAGAPGLTSCQSRGLDYADQCLVQAAAGSSQCRGWLACGCATLVLMAGLLPERWASNLDPSTSVYDSKQQLRK